MNVTYPKKIQLLEIGPRDGFQSVKEFIPTELKKQVIDRLVESGCKRIQATSFVHPKAIPQMQDAAEIVRYAMAAYPEIGFYALVPNMRGAQNAVAAGLKEISYVISVSPGHNRANVNRTLAESFAELKLIYETFPDVHINLDAATTFGCPFDGAVTIRQILDFVRNGYDIGIRTFDLCDTIGVADPVQVENTIQAVRAEFPDIELGIHIHDTRNMGMVNSLTAIKNGVTRVSATVGGLGGCPFAPGASGNTASEDLVYMLEKMEISTGIDFHKLLETAHFLRTNIPGNYSGHNINVKEQQCVMN